MSHQIDEMAPGVHAFAAAREDAWHRLGVTIPQEFDAAGAMEFAHLGGWNVRKLPMSATEITEDGVTVIESKTRFMTVRTNPVTGQTEELGDVGAVYLPIQNEAHCELLDALVDESGAHFDTAGSLRGGREVFVSMKMPEHLTIGGSDAVNLNVVALNSHDGTKPFRFLVTPVRVVCANTQAAAIRQAKSSFGIKHTSGNGGKIAEAREALGLTFKYIDAFQAEAEKLAAQSFTPVMFDRFADTLLGIDPVSPDKSSKRTLEHADNIKSLWRESVTLDGIRDTKWGAYQAVIEYWDHFAPANGSDKATARAIRTLTTRPVVDLKEHAFAMLSAA